MTERPLFWQQIIQTPFVADQRRADAFLADVAKSWQAAELGPDAMALLDDPATRALLAGAITGSRHLSMAIQQDAARTHRVLTSDPAQHLNQLITDLEASTQDAAPQKV